MKTWVESDFATHIVIKNGIVFVTEFSPTGTQPERALYCFVQSVQ